MSEYQYVAFRAIDRPLSDGDLKFMQKQSSRADITKWSFANEYNWGDFNGNVSQMLRRGFDVHMHYANFGTRTLVFRLPNKKAIEKAIKPYLVSHGLSMLADKDGPGGSLLIEPYYDAGAFEDLYNLESLFERIVLLRDEILAGDLRPLYIANLAVAGDMNHDWEESVKAPVPAGLGKLTDAQRALVEFFGLDDYWIEAAALKSARLEMQSDAAAGYGPWLDEQPDKIKKEWLTQVMAGSASVRAEMVALYQSQSRRSVWPTTPGTRTMQQLHEIAEEKSAHRVRRKKAAAVKTREKLLVKMATDPDKYLREADELIALCKSAAYENASKILADLHEALVDHRDPEMAKRRAAELAKSILVDKL